MTRRVFLVVCAMAITLVSVAVCPGTSDETTDAVTELASLDYLTLSPEEAIKECSAIISIARNATVKAEALAHRGNAYSAIGRYGLAVADFEASDVLVPNLELKCKLADCLVRSGDERKGLTSLEKLVKSYPRSAVAHAYLSGVYLHCRRVDASFASAAEAIKLDPNLPIAYFSRALCFATKGEWSSCIQDIDTYLRFRPNGEGHGPAQAHLLRATILLKQGKGDQALQSALLAQKLQPTLLKSYLLTWASYRAVEKDKACCVIGKKMIRTFPDQFDSYHCYLVSLIACNRLSDAIRFGELTSIRFSQQPEVYCRLGDAHALQRQYREAAKHYDRALHLDKDDGHALMGKAELLAACPMAEIRNGPVAKKMAIRLRETGRGDRFRGLLLLAAAYAECGDYDEAAKMAQQGVRGLAATSPIRREADRMLRAFAKKEPYRFAEFGTAVLPR